ncbi:MAG TPA: CHASE2 domain-containing protein [Dongiaceae bacterium]|jgi:signal transduction histidine kinase/CHASE2 domain-containing sensor protein|nr:CHASE2 domain-containing protein [Dongiaceae bacterium]
MAEQRHALTRHPRSWRWRLSIGLLGIAIAALYLLGLFAPADRFLSDRFFGIHARPASGKLVLVEIDPKSLQKLSTWPWSRAYHAALIQRLLAAGADRIGFDVDFSAGSAPEADAALAQAIAAAKGRVVLATFSQRDNDVRPRGVTTAAPLAAFDAATLGLVNIFSDADGDLRRYRLAEDRLLGAPKTLAAVLAAPLPPQPNAFAIDYSIAPRSIARLSYVDVLTGRFDPKSVAGKTVLVGATAVELGDRYPVPVHGYLAGVEIQALAFESLVLGRAIHTASPFWTLLGLAVLIGGMVSSSAASMRRIHLASAAGAALAIAIGLAAQIGFATALATAPWLATIGGGYLLGVLWHAREQTRAALGHRAAAARQRALMQGVFNDSFDGILIVDAAGRIELANAAAARLLETPAAALIGSPAATHLPGIDGLADDAQPREIAIALGGRDVTLALAVTRSQAAALPGRDSGEVRIVTFRDESARRAMEQAREQMVKELEAASLAKHEFLARISHELRTPLSAIIGFSSIIGEQSIGPIGNPKYAEYARDITNGGKRLLELVNDIIDVVRIEAGQFEIRTDVFEARSLLLGLSAQAHALEGFGARKLRVEVAPGAEAIRGDRHALGRAVAKLLDNAVKFTRPDGEIVLRASPGAGGAIVIAVEDNGIGIAEKAMKHVMSAFSQVTGGLNRSHEGTGLGLHLAHRIMTLLDGRLEIESRPGAGTTVRLILRDAALQASEAA